MIDEEQWRRCPCGGTYEDRQVNVTMTAERIVVGPLPQRTCPECGTRVYRLDVLQRIESIFKP